MLLFFPKINKRRIHYTLNIILSVEARLRNKRKAGTHSFFLVHAQLRTKPHQPICLASPQIYMKQKNKTF